MVHQTAEYYVELMVQPKQRAVGNQAMLYFDIPLTEVQEWQSLNGRVAEPKEEVTFVINNANSQVLVNLVKCFILSSEQHKSDILSIIQVIHDRL